MQRVVGLSVIAMIGLAISSHAQASGQLKCASLNLTRGETRDVMAKARKALPPDTAVSLTSACRNVATGHAWLETPRVRNAENTDEWWSLYCRRARVSWSCEKTLERENVLTLEIDGKQRSVILHFDDSMPFATARNMTVLSYALLTDAESQPDHCALSMSRDWPAARERYRKELTNEELRPVVSTRNGAVEVALFYSFRVIFKAGEPACWEEPLLI